jgi:hypothetical protein
MQRREGRSSIKLPEDRIVNEAMLPELRSATMRTCIRTGSISRAVIYEADHYDPEAGAKRKTGPSWMI